MTESALPLLTVYCAAYNQEAYIRRTLEGFVEQQTDFRFEVYVHDDASTDNTAAIVKEFAEKYPDLIHPMLDTENQWSKGDDSLLRIMFSTFKGKYVAFCDGDDFWTDPQKLQKQVGFLEEHPDYNLVCHNWNVISEEKLSDSPVHHLYTQAFSFTFGTLPWVWITKTLTAVMRCSALDLETIARYQYSRDVHLVYHALKESHGYFMPEVMATYRVHPGGVWSEHDANERNKTTYALYKELYQFEGTKAVRKRYMNATLAYYNGLAFGKKTWRHFGKNAKLYFEALRNISDAKDLVFCMGGLVPTKLVKWVMKTFKV